MSLLLSSFLVLGREAIPAEWTTRYRDLDAVMVAKDLGKYRTFFDSKWVLHQTDGKTTDLDAFMESIQGVFEQAAKVDSTSKLISVKVKGNVAEVSFDMTVVMHRKPIGSTTFHEVGVDSWRKSGTKWRMFKTVDHKLDVTESSQRQGG